MQIYEIFQSAPHNLLPVLFLTGFLLVILWSAFIIKDAVYDFISDIAFIWFVIYSTIIAISIANSTLDFLPSLVSSHLDNYTILLVFKVSIVSSLLSLVILKIQYITGLCVIAGHLLISFILWRILVEGHNVTLGKDLFALTFAAIFTGGYAILRKEHNSAIIHS